MLTCPLSHPEDPSPDGTQLRPCISGTYPRLSLQLKATIVDYFDIKEEPFHKRFWEEKWRLAPHGRPETKGPVLEVIKARAGDRN